VSDGIARARASLEGSGWTLDADGTFVRERDGRAPGLKVTMHRTRARVLDPNGDLYWSGPPDHVRNFTRKFWHTA